MVLDKNSYLLHLFIQPEHFPAQIAYLCIPTQAFIKPNMKISILKRMGEEYRYTPMKIKGYTEILVESQFFGNLAGGFNREETEGSAHG